MPTPSSGSAMGPAATAWSARPASCGSDSSSKTANVASARLSHPPSSSPRPRVRKAINVDANGNPKMQKRRKFKRRKVKPGGTNSIEANLRTLQILLWNNQFNMLWLLLGRFSLTIRGRMQYINCFCKMEAHGIPLTSKELATLPPFSFITFNVEDTDGTVGKCKPEVAKTGLGSSAAMTTSVVAALLHYLGVMNLPFSDKSLSEVKSFDSDLDVVNIIAQSAHCIAQGKIGSGFDVNAAIYGSQCYVRFSPSVLSYAQVFSFSYLWHIWTIGISLVVAM